jgi:ATP-dependent Clp protease ATP-binding subunit ClpC
MFERYTERARRVIFFSRYEASQFGSRSIETQHLLLGLIREDKNLTNRFLTNIQLEGIRPKIESLSEIREKVSTSIDLPLSNECKRILAYSNEEAERLGHRHIGTEHLLLGMLREESCVAARLLYESGLRLETLREELARNPDVAQTLSSMELNSRGLVSKLDKHGFTSPKERLMKATVSRSSGDFKTAQIELSLFLHDLLDVIQQHRPSSNVFSPIFEGFDWHTSIQGLRSHLPDQADWRFRFWVTVLVAELLLDRYEAGGES